MGEINLFAVAEDDALAFGRRTRDILVASDSAAWGVLLASLSSAHRLPRLTRDGRFVLDPHPIVDLAWHRSPGDPHASLVPDVVPRMESPDVRWLLSYAFLLTCELRVVLASPQFAYGWTDEIPDRRLLQSEGEREEHSQIARLFDRPDPPPDSLWFLSSTVSGPHGYLSRETIVHLLALEERTGLMTRLSQQFTSDPSESFEAFGRDIAQFHHFLALACATGRTICWSYFAL
jgi:hypothetical protein